MKANLLYLALLCFVWSCQNALVSEGQLNTYVQDKANGLTKSVSRKGIDFSVNYRPTDLLVAQELNGKPPASLADSLRKKYDTYAYFILNISKGNKEILKQSTNFADFSNHLQTLSFRMGEYVSLTTSKQDTIPVADFIYPRLYGMGQSTSLLFVFNREEINTADWVQFNLKDIGLGVGKTHFKFETADIKEIPKIDFNKK